MHTRLFNKRFEDRRTPLGVLVAADVEDVRRALVWARDQGVTPVARSGGHSFAGYSVNDGLVIDLSRLSLVRADGSTGLVTVGGGARVGQLYDAVRPYEMAFSAGTNPLVGVAGLVLGGGCEYASRRYGLTADALVQPRLGWEDAAKVLDVMQRLVWQAPDDFAARLGVSTDGRSATAIRERLAVTAVGQYFGPAAELSALLEPVLTVAQPRAREIVERTYWDAKSCMVHATSADDFAMRTSFVKQPISDAGVDTMLSWLERWPGSGNPDGGGVGLFSWGGAINRVPADATAVIHRDTLFLASMDTSWNAQDPPELVTANLRWLDGLYEAMAQYVSDSSYQNFVDPALADWQRAYYGDNFPRLVEVKRRYDPDGVLRFEQGIEG
jgi:FAD/FMN-containing dehydrogenase